MLIQIICLLSLCFRYSAHCYSTTVVFSHLHLFPFVGPFVLGDYSPPLSPLLLSWFPVDFVNWRHIKTHNQKPDSDTAPGFRECFNAQIWSSLTSTDSSMSSDLCTAEGPAVKKNPGQIMLGSLIRISKYCFGEQTDRKSFQRYIQVSAVSFKSELPSSATGEDTFVSLPLCSIFCSPISSLMFYNNKRRCGKTELMLTQSHKRLTANSHVTWILCQ